jgi:peptidoglycan/xylan/chitin deacetylase (PgdA/CDA1 family)
VRMTVVRAQLKRAVRPLRGSRAGLVLVYHRVEPRPGNHADEFSPPMSMSALSAQLEHLARRYHVVPATALLQELGAARNRRRPLVSITFDDDSVTHLRWAAPELRRIGLPATFFLNGASLDAPRTYWWDRLQTGLDLGMDWEQLVSRDVIAMSTSRQGGPTVATVSEAVQRLTPTVRQALHRDLLPLVGPDPSDAGIREEQVRALVSAGFELGFHTRDHEPLSLVDDATLHQQLREGRSDLERIYGRPLDTIAYPHGKADARVARAARDAGYRLGFTVEWARSTRSTDPLLIGRIDPTVVPRIDDFERTLASLLK